MTNLFSISPHFDYMETPEPTLDAMVFHYYREHFDMDTASDYTNKYIAAIQKEIKIIE